MVTGRKNYSERGKITDELLNLLHDFETGVKRRSSKTHQNRLFLYALILLAIPLLLWIATSGIHIGNNINTEGKNSPILFDSDNARFDYRDIKKDTLK